MASPPALASLRERIRGMEPVRLDDRTIPTAEALAPLLPGGALRAGAAYSVQGSWQLALAFLAAASRGGAWCGVIGCPSFGAEAAATLGIALDRCALIPEPGPHALPLTAALSETFAVTVARFDDRVQPGDAERLAARLREHGSALVVIGDWNRSETRLTVTGSKWAGLGTGHGMLSSRALTVRSVDRRGVGTHTVALRGGGFVADRQERPRARSLQAV